MIKIKDICSHLESIAPLAYQESYDNVGLIVGDAQQEVTSILCSLDCTEAIIDEAIAKKANLVVAHHPILFKGLKSLTGKTYVERTLLKAIKNDITIYAIHTNLDSVERGVNTEFGKKLGLSNLKILQPKKDLLSKLVVFVPTQNTSEVADALYKAGGGNIGNYSECSFKITGTGTFTPNEAANPTLGKANKKEEVSEDRIELIFPNFKQQAILTALHVAHPYEEVAYYVSQLDNNFEIGSGMIGSLPEAMSPDAFLAHLKKAMSAESIKYTWGFNGPIERVAICGGAGSFLIAAAKASGAQAYITSDIKYHEFFDAEEQLLIADIGHYESEVHTKALLFALIREKFTNIALHLSELNTNPIRYY